MITKLKTVIRLNQRLRQERIDYEQWYFELCQVFPMKRGLAHNPDYLVHGVERSIDYVLNGYYKLTQWERAIIRCHNTPLPNMVERTHTVIFESYD